MTRQVVLARGGRVDDGPLGLAAPDRFRFRRRSAVRQDRRRLGLEESMSLTERGLEIARVVRLALEAGWQLVYRKERQARPKRTGEVRGSERGPAGVDAPVRGDGGSV
jgi:hypothetical protein